MGNAFFYFLMLRTVILSRAFAAKNLAWLISETLRTAQGDKHKCQQHDHSHFCKMTISTIEKELMGVKMSAIK